MRSSPLTHVLRVGAVIAFVAMAACSDPPAPPGAVTSKPEVPPAPSAAAAPAERQTWTIVDALPLCDVEHRGLLFDAGARALVGRTGWEIEPPQGLALVEHGGATWARVTQRNLPITFVLSEPSRIFVAGRVLGKSAKSASVYLDDQPLGTWTLPRADPKVVSTSATTLRADAGLHTISIRFGRRPFADEPLADIDWIRVGIPDELPTTFGGLTGRDLVLPNAALAGVPHRAIALRAPGAVRCPVRPRSTSIVRVAVGLQGAGEGKIALVATRDGAPVERIAEAKLKGGEGAKWIDLEASLAPFAGAPIGLSFVAEAAPKGVRVLFGDPVVVDQAPPAQPVPSARAVVLVVYSGVERRDLPPWSDADPPTFPVLSTLAASSTVFDAHRSPTTMVGAAMASMLTGKAPLVHRLTDPAARLPATETMIGRVARDAGVRVAMFTGVPHTYRAFGFAEGWEKFEEHFPSSGDPATTPLDHAASWITDVTREDPGARFVVVIHARGGHPPWDVTPKELSALEPKDYSGPIEPRRAAQVFGKLRKKPKNKEVLSATDRDRMRQLFTLAMTSQNRSLANLLSVLKNANLWDQTLFVLSGDVSSGLSQIYSDTLTLAEADLDVPLYVHFPGGALAGARVKEPTEAMDIARTALLSLGLAPGDRPGRDLAVIAAGTGLAPAPASVAIMDNTFLAKWGSLVLSGRSGAPPLLCDLGLDATCAVNRREVSPFATQAMFRRVAWVYAEDRAPNATREPATIDADTAAQLRVWGSLE